MSLYYFQVAPTGRSVTNSTGAPTTASPVLSRQNIKSRRFNGMFLHVFFLSFFLQKKWHLPAPITSSLAPIQAAVKRAIFVFKQCRCTYLFIFPSSALAYFPRYIFCALYFSFFHPPPKKNRRLRRYNRQRAYVC